MIGNIPPFFITYGPASATQPGFLTASGNQALGGDKQPTGIWTFSGRVVVAASTTTQAGFNLGGNGTAPTSPVNGDMWMNSSSIPFIRTSSTTNQIALLGNTQTFTASQTFGSTVTISSAVTGTGLNVAVNGGRALLQLQRTTSSAQAWTVETGATTGLRFVDITGSTTTRMELATTGALSLTAPLIPQTYTLATVPTASSYTRGVIWISDMTGTGKLAYSDGTNWRRVADDTIAS